MNLIDGRFISLVQPSPPSSHPWRPECSRLSFRQRRLPHRLQRRAESSIPLLQNSMNLSWTLSAIRLTQCTKPLSSSRPHRSPQASSRLVHAHCPRTPSRGNQRTPPLARYPTCNLVTTPRTRSRSRSRGRRREPALRSDAPDRARHTPFSVFLLPLRGTPITRRFIAVASSHRKL